MGKNVTAETFKAAVADRKGGMKMAEVMAKHDLSHSQLELAIMRLDTLKDQVGSVPATAEGITKARQAGHSWGVISVLANVPESRVRKIWAEATNLKSQGLRTGKGGRFYYGDSGQPLYTGEDLKTTGTAIRRDEKMLEGALKAADDQRNLVKEPIEKVVALYTKVTGRKPARGFTKAQLIMAIRAAERKAAPVKKATKARKPVAKKAEAPKAD